MNNALAFAQDIIDMHEEIAFLRSEVARLEGYERKYRELLDQSVHHGEQMMGNWLQLLMKPAVAAVVREQCARVCVTVATQAAEESVRVVADGLAQAIRSMRP